MPGESDPGQQPGSHLHSTPEDRLRRSTNCARLQRERHRFHRPAQRSFRFRPGRRATPPSRRSLHVAGNARGAADRSILAAMTRRWSKYFGLRHPAFGASAGSRQCVGSPIAGRYPPIPPGFELGNSHYQRIDRQKPGGNFSIGARSGGNQVVNFRVVGHPVSTQKRRSGKSTGQNHFQTAGYFSGLTQKPAHFHNN